MPSHKEDKLPLVNDDSDPSEFDQNYPQARKQVERLMQQETRYEFNGASFGAADESSRISLMNNSSVSQLQPDCILCVFVVAFDTRSGEKC